MKRRKKFPVPCIVTYRDNSTKGFRAGLYIGDNRLIRPMYNDVIKIREKDIKQRTLKGLKNALKTVYSDLSARHLVREFTHLIKE